MELTGPALCCSVFFLSLTFFYVFFSFFMGIVNRGHLLLGRVAVKLLSCDGYSGYVTAADAVCCCVGERGLGG